MVIHACGMPRLSSGPGIDVVHLRPRDIGPRLPARVLVLAVGVLGELEPSDVRQWLRNGRHRVVFCGDTWSAERLAAWADMRPGSVVTEACVMPALDDLVRRFTAGLVRYPIALEDWLGRPLPRDATALHALSVLPTIHPIHDVQLWARAAGLGKSGLWAAIQRALQLAPRDAYLQFVDAQVRRCDAEGVSRSDAAHMLGYKDPSGLAHALQRVRGGGRGVAA